MRMCAFNDNPINGRSLLISKTKHRHSFKIQTSIREIQYSGLNSIDGPSYTDESPPRESVCLNTDQ